MVENLFNRVVRAKMSRPKVYFASMTDDEVLRYATQYAETELEKALMEIVNNRYLNDAVEEFIATVSDVAGSAEDISRSRTASDLCKAVAKIESTKG